MMGEAGEEESAAAPAEVSRQAELDEQRCLAEALDALSSLVSASLSATLFPLKWQLTRDRLHACLADTTVPAGDESGEDRRDAFVNLLRDVAATAREARELVPRSQGRQYGGGKLRLRSDLDVLAAALDAHVARLDEVHASGALTRARALVVPRPGAGATRDDVRFYVRDLFARLRAGGAEMRREAATALSEVLRDDEKCVRVVASDVADGVGVLVALLECPDARVREDVLEAVSVIAGSDAHRGDLVVGGVIAPVVRVLDAAASASSEAAKERAARVLCKLTENSDNAWAVAAHGGVTALLDLCTDHGASGGELVCAACRVLRSLAGVDEIRKYMVADAGAVPVLVSLSQRATDDAARIQAMELVVAIGSGDSSAREAVVQEGAIEVLVRALDASSSSKVREVALRAIDGLCLSPPTSTDRLLAAGFLDSVLSLLRTGDTTLQHCALKAAHRLCPVSEEIRKAMGDAGFMLELVSVLGASSKSPEAREMAAESLCALVSVHRNRKRFVQEDRDDVARVLQLLGSGDEEKLTPAKRFLLSTVTRLADSSSGRRKILTSEHVRNLEKLAETDVPDAKRIVKRLGGSRLRSIFHGIWSL
ncbi:uncharacterized protein [Zea mays]|uniref:ARM repeat superfamily protein n=1 Tax=Zea mays TaxID=4577 RepID=A0A804QDM9_MAIZE|nr:uncharacterized protein LOC100274194 isoform X1 [Zea mays]|eukprot:XP_008651126.1 putative ARM repeat-containing protein containing family protein isoform X1 [Zea mays]